MAQLLFKLDY